LYNCKVLQKVPLVNTDTLIVTFSDENYRFLSNFHPSEVFLNNNTERYKTVEHAYQAAKSSDPETRKLFQDPYITPGKAKILGTNIHPIRKDWEDVKLEIMEYLLLQKFKPGSELGILLEEKTKGKMIVEGNHWHDTFWGKCFCSNHLGEGQNKLGYLLMKIRDGIIQVIDSLEDC
jgi:hypothetical protein